jgi:hypothetical protein
VDLLVKAILALPFPFPLSVRAFQIHSVFLIYENHWYISISISISISIKLSAAPSSFWPHVEKGSTNSLSSTLAISPYSQLFETSKLGSRVTREHAATSSRPQIEGLHLLYQLDQWDDQSYVSGVRHKLSSVLNKIFFR